MFLFFNFYGPLQRSKFQFLYQVSSCSLRTPVVVRVVISSMQTNVESVHPTGQLKQMQVVHKWSCCKTRLSFFFLKQGYLNQKMLKCKRQTLHRPPTPCPLHTCLGFTVRVIILLYQTLLLDMINKCCFSWK